MTPIVALTIRYELQQFQCKKKRTCVLWFATAGGSVEKPT